MTAPVVTRTVQDLATEIKRLFGDESGVQIVDSDIIRWVNFGQVEICSKTRVLKKIQVGSLIVGTNTYPTPTDYLEMEAVWIDGTMIQATSWEDFRQQSYNNAETGTPLTWFLYANQINLFPNPNSVKELRIFYAALPIDVTTLGSPLSIPDRYFDRLKEYCMSKAYELDEDWTAHQVQREQMETNLREMNGADQTMQGPYLVARDTEDEWENSGW